MKFESLKPKAQTAIDLYLNRGHGRDKGRFQCPQDLEVLLCVYFLCHDRGDGTGVHIRRCQPLAHLCLQKLRDGFEAAVFVDMVRALETYCELQNSYFDNDLQACMGRIIFDQGVLAALNNRQDYQDLLRSGAVHPQQMALLLNRAAVLYAN